ncbi:unnamed protein product, partial [Mesorhabditis belari]|uniref:Uncharacterized protein n=1 Tax=Mesorhabditis belari TaxID=2138241 RepID=A0AAF3EYN3_9BILA
MPNVLWRVIVISLFITLGSFNNSLDLKLVAYWHNVLMRSIIKAKLNREKVHLSKLDAALADLCLDEAKTLLDRIQCLETVLQKRDAAGAQFKLIQSIDKNIEMLAPKLTSKRRLLDSALSRMGKYAKSSSSGPPKSKSKFQTASVLSPRFFSFSNQQYSDILSPRIFALRSGGILSLNDLGKAKGAINLSMAKFLIEISGAGKAIRHIYAGMAPEIRQIREEVYPDMIELASHTLNWVKARKLMNSRQRCEMTHYGYTHMTPQQIQLVYNRKNKFSQELPFDLNEYGDLDEEGRERRVEFLLSNMLYLGKNLNETNAEIVEEKAFVIDNSTGPIPPNPIQLRVKRTSPEEGPPGFTNRTNGILYEVLRPYAFDVLSGTDAYLEVLVLSPSSFTLEIFQPELLVLGVLSPRAFAAVVLSPGALITRVLSPMGFKFEVLAPRALTAWVLSPEGFVADVLTPTFLEPRVLSPIGSFVSILSPNVLGPHIGGTDNMGITVLSPNILSPRIAQRERLMIEILSPHIMGGEHLHAHHAGGHEPEEDNDEPAAGGHTAIEMVDLHGLAHDVDEDDPITLEKLLGEGEEWAEREIMPDDRHLLEFLRIPLPPSQAVAHSEHLAAEAAAGAEHHH